MLSITERNNTANTNTDSQISHADGLCRYFATALLRGTNAMRSRISDIDDMVGTAPCFVHRGKYSITDKQTGSMHSIMPIQYHTRFAVKSFIISPPTIGV